MMALPVMPPLGLQWFHVWMLKLRLVKVAASDLDAQAIIHCCHCFKPQCISCKYFNGDRAPLLVVDPLPLIASCPLSDGMPFHVSVTEAQVQLHKKCNVFP